MRVNMDSSVATEPRFKKLGKVLSITWREALGSCFLVWLACYERRTELMMIEEIDIAAEVDGFAMAMVAAGLAHTEDEHPGCVIVHGVTTRIKFLEKQKTKGKAGGTKSGKARKKPENKANEAYGSGAAQAGAEPNGSGAAQAYPPAPALSPAPPPALSPPVEAVCADWRIDPFTELVAAWDAAGLPGSGKIERNSQRVGWWQLRFHDPKFRVRWREVVARAGRSDRCRGLTAGWGGLFIDTFLRDEKNIITRILEGEFDNPGVNRPPPAPTKFVDPNNIPTNVIAPPPPKKERAA